MREYVIGRVAGLQVTVRTSALIATPVAWAIYTFAAVKKLRLSLRAASGLALGVVLGHWLLSFWHHFGHALAARTTGYPMVGIRLWGILATSVYRPNEPPLPAALHVRRALGGPIASAMLTSILWRSLRAVRSTRISTRWMLRWLLLDNVLLFTAQMFVPLGINDGTTLLRWLPELRDKTPR